MPMKVVILAGGPAIDFENSVANLSEIDDVFYVGVDRGAYRLMQAGFPVDLAVGDFDSLSQTELAAVSDYAAEIKQSPAEKDDTDLELAILNIMTRFQEFDGITILGGLGGRFDHAIQVFYLVSQPRFEPLIDKITLCDRQNVICFARAGSHVITKNPDMTYLAFASMTPVKGFEILAAKYLFPKTDFQENFSLSSNEFVDHQPAKIAFSSGLVAIIQSKD